MYNLNLKIILLYEDRKEWINRTKQKKILSRFLATEKEIFIIKEELSKVFDVKLIKYTQESYSKIYSELNKEENIIFWNLTDGYDIFIGSHIPSFVTILNKPYIGSCTYMQALSQNKHHLKSILKEHKIKTPNWAYFDIDFQNDWYQLEKLHYPVFIKPANFDNSIGTEYIDPISLNIKDTKEKVKILFNHGINKVIVENFLENKEITLACIQLDEWKLFPMHQMYKGKYISSYAKEGDSGYIYSQEFINNQDIIDIGKKILTILDIKDYCRMDFRYDSNNQINLLEINTGTFLTTKPFTTVSKLFFNGNRSDMFSQIIKYAYLRQL